MVHEDPGGPDEAIHHCSEDGAQAPYSEQNKQGVGEGSQLFHARSVSLASFWENADGPPFVRSVLPPLGSSRDDYFRMVMDLRARDGERLVPKQD